MLMPICFSCEYNDICTEEDNSHDTELMCVDCAHFEVCRYKEELEKMDTALRRLAVDQPEIFTTTLDCEYFQLRGGR